MAEVYGVKLCSDCDHIKRHIISEGRETHTCWHPDVLEKSRRVNVITGNISYDGMSMMCDVLRSRNGMCGKSATRFKEYDGERKWVNQTSGILFWKRTQKVSIDKRVVFGHPSTVDAVYFPCHD
jgi:hypothetical protein